MINLMGADDQGIVTDMIKHANESFKSALVTFFNQIIFNGSFDESWFKSILQMLPEDRELNELTNLHLIVLLPIFYKRFSRFA